MSTYINILRVGCMIYIATMDTYACTCVVSFTDTNCETNDDLCVNPTSVGMAYEANE